MSDGKKLHQKNEFIFHPVKVIKNMLYFPCNLKL